MKLLLASMLMSVNLPPDEIIVPNYSADCGQTTGGGFPPSTAQKKKKKKKSLSQGNTILFSLFVSEDSPIGHAG